MDLINDTLTGTPDFIGYRQAAALLGVPVGTLYCWTHQRRIPHVRLGKRLVRFERQKLLQFLQEHEVPAAASSRAI